MPPSDVVVLENVQAMAQQLTPFKPEK